MAKGAGAAGIAGNRRPRRHSRYLVSVDSLNEMLDVINALESEVEHLTIQQMFTARGDKEQWETGSELSQSAQESLKRRKEKIHAFLYGGR